jgi:N-acetyltransferase
MWYESTILTGMLSDIVPLSSEHADGLRAAVSDGELWRLWYTTAPTPASMDAVIADRLSRNRAGIDVPFTIVDRARGTILGATNYLSLDQRNRRLEIGGTWLRSSVQRTGVNTEVKYHLLTHAFETLGCVAVELRTHALNAQSRAAIERLGAKLDGVLRNHRVSANGTLRDTCVYSIIQSEWPTIKAHLTFLRDERRS